MVLLSGADVRKHLMDMIMAHDASTTHPLAALNTVEGRLKFVEQTRGWRQREERFSAAMSDPTGRTFDKLATMAQISDERHKAAAMASEVATVGSLIEEAGFDPSLRYAVVLRQLCALHKHMRKDGSYSLKQTKAAQALGSELGMTAQAALEMAVPMIEHRALRLISDLDLDLDLDLPQEVIRRLQVLHDPEKPQFDSEGAICEDLKVVRYMYCDWAGLAQPIAKAWTKPAEAGLDWWLESPSMPWHEVVTAADGTTAFELTELNFEVSRSTLGKVQAAQRRLAAMMASRFAALPQAAALFVAKQSPQTLARRAKASATRRKKKEVTQTTVC
jgi:hypothetical protein